MVFDVKRWSLLVSNCNNAVRSFLMICGGLLWPVVIYDGMWWSMTPFDGL